MTDGGWTLIARFSNADAKNWMQSSGSFWYDQGEYGSTTSPSTNADMINRAFFEIAGNDIKLSRSDVSAHSFLLYAGACFPSSTTFRGKMSSYGNFRYIFLRNLQFHIRLRLQMITLNWDTSCDRSDT